MTDAMVIARSPTAHFEQKCILGMTLMRIALSLPNRTRRTQRQKMIFDRTHRSIPLLRKKEAAATNAEMERLSVYLRDERGDTRPRMLLRHLQRPY